MNDFCCGIQTSSCMQYPSHSHTNTLPLLTGNAQRKRGDRRPPVPHKPTNITSAMSGPKSTTHATSPPSSSPPLPRRRSEDTPSPPPPPAPYLPSQNQRRLNAVGTNSDANNSDTNNSEYEMLENARTLDPLGRYTYITLIELALPPLWGMDVLGLCGSLKYELETNTARLH